MVEVYGLRFNSLYPSINLLLPICQQYITQVIQIGDLPYYGFNPI